MKLQYLAVVFAIIIIPISFIMSQYIQTQIDSIVLQSAYTSNLNNATSDALKAFQINSVNNKYSSVSDSKIRDIEASINTFYNSLGTSMEDYISSREDLATFIPAMLYTLYDGYYIYSSYNNIYSTTGTGEDTKVQIKDNLKYQDGLRPYIYYSCKYKLKNGKIIIINYTLDNAITVYGDVGDRDGDGYGDNYSTISGYLINPEAVKDINVKTKTLNYGEVQIAPETLVEHLLTIEKDADEREYVEQGDYKYIVYNNKKVYLDNKKDANNQPQYFWYDNYKKTYLKSEKENLEKYLNSNGVGFKSTSAFDYYYEAYKFSIWVNKYLGDVTQADVIKMDETETTIGSDTTYLSTDTGVNTKLFDTTATNNDPLRSDSIFNTHRMSIIRKSIETNLTTAIANYNAQSGSNYEFVMPIIDEYNWDKIVNQISLTTFMQGFPIGTKYYNNYSVITNTKNEEVINEQSVYVLTRQGNSIEYHQPGCKELIENQDKIVGSYTAISFQRQTVKVSESNIHYFYPQARNNATTTGCYNCIVNASGDYNIDDIISGTIKTLDGTKVLYNQNDLYNVRKMYLTALARERYDLYKSNFR